MLLSLLRFRAAPALLALAALSVVGCRDGSPRVLNEFYSQAARFTVEVRGHRNVSFDGEWRLVVLRNEGAAGIQLLVVGTDTPIETPEWTIEAFVELVDFRGDGTYEARPPTGAGQQQLVNDAYAQIVQRMPSGMPEAFRYDRVVKPCRFRIETEGRKGSAVCDGLAADEGASLLVTLEMSWEGHGPLQRITPEPTPSATATAAPTST